MMTTPTMVINVHLSYISTSTEFPVDFHDDLVAVAEQIFSLGILYVFVEKLISCFS